MTSRASDRPRVLVIAAPPMDGHSGTGVTLANLFSSLPPAQVAQLHLDGGWVDPNRCGSSLVIPDKGSPLAQSIRSRLMRRVPSTSATPDIMAARSQDDGRARARAWAAAFLDLAPVQIPPGITKWAEDQRPDIIYSPLGSVRVMRIVNRMAEHLGVPVVPHFMDDWTNSLFSHGELGGVARRVSRRQLEQIVSRSPFFLGISAPMVQEYEKIFGRAGRVFMNCVADGDFALLPQAKPAPVRVLTYIGGLHLDRWQSLGHLADDLLKVAPEVKLQVHAPVDHLRQHLEHIGRRDNIIWGPSLEPEGVAHALAAADVAVHVEARSPEARQFTRLSISTKLPQYFASGRPVLAIGPPELASMRYVHETGAGAVLDEGDRRALRNFFADHVSRAEMGRRGLAKARECHARSTVSRNFVRTLADASRVD